MTQQEEQVLKVLEYLINNVFGEGASSAKATIEFGSDDNGDEYELVMTFKKKGSSE